MVFSSRCRVTRHCRSFCNMCEAQDGIARPQIASSNVGMELPGAAEGWRRPVMKGRDWEDIRGRKEKKRMMETKWGQNENVDLVLYGFKQRKIFIQSSISGCSRILWSGEDFRQGDSILVI